MSFVKCAAVFSDNMVLQRKKPIFIWGVADECSEITVVLKGASDQYFCSQPTKAKNKKWETSLPAMEAGGPYIMELLCNGTFIRSYKNIMIGEVWLAGGQSNMEYELQNELHGKEELASIKDYNIRFYQVNRNAYFDDYFYISESENTWMCPDEISGKTWSAVGYYFAKKLSLELNVTIGIIGCNWGGTSACAWQSKESLLKKESTSIYWTEFETLLAAQNAEEYAKERIDYSLWQADWQPRMDAYYREHPHALWQEALDVVGECKWPGPMGPMHEFRPGGLYSTMLQRIIPYTLAGCIYYQGESDDHRPTTYQDLLSSLIEQWRGDFKQDSLPFLFVQLPMHHNISEPHSDKWCFLREGQMQVHKTLKNTGIAVAIDCGQYNDIHPIHKAPVGLRLALQALHHVYDLLSENEVYGPIYQDYRVEDNGIYISFDYCNDGFLLKNETAEKNDKITGFELAGKDGIYYTADAQILHNQIYLTCSEVTAPISARYLWVDYSTVTLFGANGIPVAPFRT